MTPPPLFDPKDRVLDPGLADPDDTSLADLRSDPDLYKAMYLKSIGLGGMDARSPHDQWRANRFEDVQAQYALNAANLYGFGGDTNVTEGRSFQEHLDLIKAGGGDRYKKWGNYNTNQNLSAIQDLSDQGVTNLRQNIGDLGLNANDIMNTAFRNATTARFGRNFGGGISRRALAQRNQFAISPEALEGQSFTRQLLDQLRRRFGIESGDIAPRANKLSGLRNIDLNVQPVTT